MAGGDATEENKERVNELLEFGAAVFFLSRETLSLSLSLSLTILSPD